MNAITNRIIVFLRDEEGAQVVEYALIIAIVSIGLVVALGDATSGLKSTFVTLVGRITDCFTAGKTCT